uniref:Uncharacterized protein n=1 Tax=Leersia perrieri TaxID=77586 RepID=A0A0D9VHH3_9ORYZ
TAPAGERTASSRRAVVPSPVTLARRERIKKTPRVPFPRETKRTRRRGRERERKKRWRYFVVVGGRRSASQLIRRRW